MEKRNRSTDSRWRFLWLACWLAAFHPNCARCCPVGVTGCTCKYAWEDCPSNSGCGSCGSCSTTRLTTAPTDLAEAGNPGFNSVAIEAGTISEAGAIDDPPGGTIAFVRSATGAYVVSSIPESDRVHVVHLEATAWEEDPLTIRTIGDVEFARGDEPGRVISSHLGRAHVVLRRGGAIAAIDPATASILERARACAAPRGLVYDASSDVIHTACASGEVITFSAATSQEVKHQFISSGLEDVTLGRGSIFACTRTRIIRIAPDGSLDAHETHGAIGALRGTASGDVTVAFRNESTAFGTLTAEGAIGPWIAVRSAPFLSSDLDIGSDGTVVLVGGREAFILSSGAPAFASVGAPGLARAIAIGEVTTGAIQRRIVAVQTDSPRMLVFFDLGNPRSILGIEPM